MVAPGYRQTKKGKKKLSINKRKTVDGYRALKKK